LFQELLLAVSHDHAAVVLALAGAKANLEAEDV
jgi:hypothetical protein